MSLQVISRDLKPAVSRCRQSHTRVLRWPVAASQAEALGNPAEPLPWVTGDNFPAAADLARQRFPELTGFLLLCPFSGHWLGFEVRDGRAVRLPGIVAAPNKRESEAWGRMWHFLERGIKHLEAAGVDLDQDDPATAGRKVQAWIAAGRPGAQSYANI